MVTYLPALGIWRRGFSHSANAGIDLAAILVSNLAEFSQIKYTHIRCSNDIAPGYLSQDIFTRVHTRTYTVMLTAILFASVHPWEVRWVKSCGGT